MKGRGRLKKRIKRSFLFILLIILTEEAENKHMNWKRTPKPVKGTTLAADSESEAPPHSLST